VSALGFLGLLAVPIGFCGDHRQPDLRPGGCGKSRGDTAMWLAVAGLLMSLVFFIVRVPVCGLRLSNGSAEGFHRLNFMSDISKKVSSRREGEVGRPPSRPAGARWAESVHQGVHVSDEADRGAGSFLPRQRSRAVLLRREPGHEDMFWSTWLPGKTVNFSKDHWMSIGGRVFHCQRGAGAGRITAGFYDRRNVRRELSYDVLTRPVLDRFRVVFPPRARGTTMDPFGKLAG